MLQVACSRVPRVGGFKELRRRHGGLGAEGSRDQQRGLEGSREAAEIPSHEGPGCDGRGTRGWARKNKSEVPLHEGLDQKTIKNQIPVHEGGREGLGQKNKI